jgi:hypothetical protein
METKIIFFEKKKMISLRNLGDQNVMSLFYLFYYLEIKSSSFFKFLNLLHNLHSFLFLFFL